MVREKKQATIVRRPLAGTSTPLQPEYHMEASRIKLSDRKEKTPPTVQYSAVQSLAVESDPSRKSLTLCILTNNLKLANDLVSKAKAVKSFRVQTNVLSDYQEAFEDAKNNLHDLYLVDHHFSQRHGIDFIRKATRNGCQSPFIFISVNEKYSLDELAIKAGALDYMVPEIINASRFERLITNCLERNKINIEQDLKNRFSNLLLRISTELINLSPDQIESQLQITIEKISAQANLEAAAMYRNNVNSTILSLSHSWVSDSDSDASVIPDKLNAESFSVGQTVFNDESSKRASIGKQYNIALKINEKLAGVIVFASEKERESTYLEDENVRESIAQIFANAIQRQSEYNARVKAEEAFRTVLDGTASTTAENFFKSLVKQLAQVLSTKYAFVARIDDPNKLKAKTLAVWKDNAYIGNEDYYLKDSPSMKIVEEGFVEYRDGMQQHFPNDKYLKIHEIESYMGSILVDSNEKPIGVLVVMDSKPLPDWLPANFILKIFAARAGAELERIIIEEESTLLQLKLQQSQKMEAIGQLAAGIAHDLNNALFAVTGHLQLIKLGAMSEPQLDLSVNSALTGCERASSLIGQLLCFSRQGKYNVEPVCLQEVVRETLDFLSKVIGKDVIINLETSRTKYHTMADLAQLQQALTNIIINAMQAMPKGGSLSFNYFVKDICKPQKYNFKSKPGQYVCLAITDTGYGIDNKNLEKIFEPFFTTKETGKGTGLGLSMVYGIMQNHGGWIEVNSRLGLGSCFMLYFPLQKAAETKVVSETTQVIIPEHNGTVLVLDDEPVLVDLMKQFLERLGIKSFGFTSAREALDWFKNNSAKIDMIICDMRMPEMDGEEFFRHAREINQKIAFVMLSGYIQDESAQRVLNAGALRFLSKPLKYGELASWVAESIRSNRATASVLD